MKRWIVVAGMALALVSQASAAPWLQQPAPVLTPSQPWEQRAIGEPSVIYTDGVFKMWYGGGWTDCSLGYAESTDGFHWTKYPGNPILPPDSCRNAVVQTSGGYRVFYSSGLGYARDVIMTRTSRDGIHFGAATVALEPPAWASALANSFVWVDNGTWRMLFEARTQQGWRMGLAEGASATSLRYVRALPMLEPGHTSGPWVTRCDDEWCLYFHGGPSGDLPSDIYLTHTTDFRSFTEPQMIVTRQGWEYDQVADPSVVTVHGVQFVYFSGVNNPESAGAIGLATRADPAEQSCPRIARRAC